MTMRVEAPFYNELLERKNNGEKLDFSKITRDELKTLYLVEDRLQSEIIDLYGIKKSQLQNKISSWDLRIRDYLFEKFQNKISESYSENYLSLVFENVNDDLYFTDNVGQAFDKYNSLTEKEKKAFFEKLQEESEYYRLLRSDALKYRALQQSFSQVSTQ